MYNIETGDNMKKIIIITISWLLVIAWMGGIFYLSNMKGEESTAKSTKAVETTIKKTVETTNKVGLTNKNPESKKIKEKAKELNFTARKSMHVFEYFVLTLLLINALYQSGVKGKKIFLIALIISILYACTDEYHQYFRERTSSLIDILIDTSGALLSIILLSIIIKLRKRKNIKAN